MPFSHITLGAVPLNDSEAHENEKKKEEKKGIRWSFAYSLTVKRLKTGVFQLKDPPDKAQKIWR